MIFRGFAVGPYGTNCFIVGSEKTKQGMVVDPGDEASAILRHTKELGLKYERSTDADKKTIKETLRGKLAELFDLKTKAQELRVKHMEAEIVSLKKNLESRRANKAKIVEQRLEQMTGEGYGW